MTHKHAKSVRHSARLLAGPLLVATLAGSAMVLADPPASVTYTYDDAGRLKTGTYSDGKLVGYEYDPAGNRTSMTQGVPVQLSIAPSMPAEGSSAGFVITKTGTALGTVSVDCVQTPGTATAGSDYTPNAQTLTFLVNETSKTCYVATVQDSIYEQNQTFTALLQNPMGTAAITTGSAIGTINDDDAGPAFSVSSAGSNTEGGGFTFTISKSGSTELSHNIGWATGNGTASSTDNDFTAVSSSRTFAPGETTFNVGVSSIADAKYELNETFVLNLSGASNGSTIGTSQGGATINNDDAVPSFFINSPAAVNEGSVITFTVTKGGNTNTGVNHSFNWATANNTAVSPSDYTAASGTVDFAPGDSTRTIQVQSVTDGVVDSATNESFFVNLTTNGNSNGGALSGSQGTGTVTDINNSIPGQPGDITITRNPSNTVSTWPNFTVSWGGATGTVHHYELDESGTLHTVTGATSKAFTYGDTFQGQKVYKVRACGTAGSTQCGTYTPTATKFICPTFGCP